MCIRDRIDTYGWRTMIGAIVPLAILVLVLGVFMLKNVGELKNPKLCLLYTSRCV